MRDAVRRSLWPLVRRYGFIFDKLKLHACNAQPLAHSKGMKSNMQNDKANVVLTVKMPNGETFTQEAKFFRVLKPLRTGGYRETFRMDVMRGKKWKRWIHNANSTEQLVEMAKRNGYQINAA